MKNPAKNLLNILGYLCFSQAANPMIFHILELSLITVNSFNFVVTNFRGLGKKAFRGIVKFVDCHFKFVDFARGCHRERGWNRQITCQKMADFTIRCISGFYNK